MIMSLVEELKKLGEEERAFPRQTLEQWPAFLRHRRDKDPEGKGNCKLDEYEVESLCNLIAAATKPAGGA
jgi:hypothetical protein